MSEENSAMKGFDALLEVLEASGVPTAAFRAAVDRQCRPSGIPAPPAAAAPVETPTPPTPTGPVGTLLRKVKEAEAFVARVRGIVASLPEEQRNVYRARIASRLAFHCLSLNCGRVDVALSIALKRCACNVKEEILAQVATGADMKRYPGGQNSVFFSTVGFAEAYAAMFVDTAEAVGKELAEIDAQCQEARAHEAEKVSELKAAIIRSGALAAQRAAVSQDLERLKAASIA